MKKMYAVVHKDHIKSATVLLMASTKKVAVELWEDYNHGHKMTDAKKNGWLIVKYNVAMPANE